MYNLWLNWKYAHITKIIQTEIMVVVVAVDVATKQHIFDLVTRDKH